MQDKSVALWPSRGWVTRGAMEGKGFQRQDILEVKLYTSGKFSE